MKTKLNESVNAPVGDFPPLARAVFPGDRVTILPDPFAVEQGEILAAVIEILRESGVTASDITVLLRDGEWDRENESRPIRRHLPEPVAEAISIGRFEPQISESCSILGLAEDGEPIALARSIVDADVVLPVERYYAEPPVGHFGFLSVIVPRFADRGTQIRFQAVDQEDQRSVIVQAFQKEIANTAQRVGVAMVLEILTDPDGTVQSFLFGEPNGVRAALGEEKR